jgi:hypothetical protein
MSFESDLKTFLQSNATITGQVSTRSEPSPRRHLQTAPDITWFVVSTRFEQSLDDAIKGTFYTVQFDSFGTDDATTQGVIAALKTGLQAITWKKGLTFLGEWQIPQPEDLPISQRALRVEIHV